MGAGAVGCYHGFKLARAGHDAVLIGRPQHVEAVERLRLETQTFDGHIRVSARSVESIDTESGAAAFRPHLAPDALVLPLQNGQWNLTRIGAILPTLAIHSAGS